MRLFYRYMTKQPESAPSDSNQVLSSIDNKLGSEQPKRQLDENSESKQAGVEIASAKVTQPTENDTENLENGNFIYSDDSKSIFWI